MTTALISLGSNLGDSQLALDSAIARLRSTRGVAEVVASTYHATDPIGGPPEQDGFLNAAARLETTLSPHKLLEDLQKIEREFGRTRDVAWGPRTLDLDLLLYDRQVLDEPDLVVPHRFLPFRRFVLQPACEVAEWMVHPRLCWTIDDMLRHARTAPRVFEIWGGPADETEWVAARVAAKTRLAVAEEKLASEVLGAVARCFRLSGKGTTESARREARASGRVCKAVFFLMPREEQTRLAEDAVDLLSVPSLVLPADDLNRAVREAVGAIEAIG